jgi:hydrophobic/amphiphilic exporter-1 (mainly G- bacteria), HAE1 family
MIASTCLAVLAVPAFFVLLQRFEEWRVAKRDTSAAPAAAPLPAPSAAPGAPAA